MLESVLGLFSSMSLNCSTPLWRPVWYANEHEMAVVIHDCIWYSWLPDNRQALVKESIRSTYHCRYSLVAGFKQKPSQWNTERIQSQVGDSPVEMTLGWKALNQLNPVHVLNHLSEIISLKLKSRSLSFGFRGSLPFVNNRGLILFYQNNVAGCAWSQGSTGRNYLIRFGLKINLMQRRKPSFRNSCIPGYAKAIPVKCKFTGCARSEDLSFAENLHFSFRRCNPHLLNT
jgi:hypothetical protein